MDAVPLHTLGKPVLSRYFADMDDLRINLSDREQTVLGEYAAEAGHATVEDYAAAVIRADLKAKAQEKLDTLLLEGLKGDSTEWTDADSNRLIRLAQTGQ